MVSPFRVDVFTLFPEVIDHYADASILGRARVRGLLDLRTHDVREATTDPHRSVDDAPFGGGAGMVMSPEPVFAAVERVADHLVDEELSVGDFVLAGGELAALVVVEAVVRLLPGVLGNDQSADDESFSAGLLEYPQYTRPASFRSWDVPEVLRSGDHGKVDRWRRAEALARTLRRRPDLVEARGGLAPDEVTLLVEHDEVQLLREHGYDW